MPSNQHRVNNNNNQTALPSTPTATLRLVRAVVGPASGIKGESTLLATADPYQAPALSLPLPLLPTLTRGPRKPPLQQQQPLGGPGALALLRSLYPSIPTRALEASPAPAPATAVEEEQPQPPPPPHAPSWHDGRWSAPLAEAERFLALKLGRLPFEKKRRGRTRGGGAPVAGAGGGGGRGGRVEARRFVGEGRELAWLAEAVAADVRRGAYVRAWLVCRMCVCVCGWGVWRWRRDACSHARIHVPTQQGSACWWCPRAGRARARWRRWRRCSRRPRA